MTPADAIAMLDAQIGDNGQSVTLRRPGSPPTDVSIKGFVRGFKPEELVGGISQGDLRVTLSPTGLGAWPLPVKAGDKVVVAGELKNVEAPEHVRMLDTLVRINLTVRG